MNTQRIEVIPATWTDEHDVPFFRAVREIFPRQLLDAATVLLASYDADVFDETNSGSWGNAPTRRRVLESVAADISR